MVKCGVLLRAEPEDYAIPVSWEYVSGGGSNVADWKLLDLQVD
tara:strand:+ start:4057 stop:4185 length:129 start_codon:yes stop_codon:yes gene_type:complete